MTTTPATPSTTSADLGLLPQTETKPDASSATFTAQVNALWSAVVADDPARAMPFFFPLSAYKQVKSISDPEATGTPPRRRRSRKTCTHGTRSSAPTRRARSSRRCRPERPGPVDQPGAEYNKGSYWRVYGTTLRYQVDGRTGTFTIASMISWRGEWYVVHLGLDQVDSPQRLANVRTRETHAVGREDPHHGSVGTDRRSAGAVPRKGERGLGRRALPRRGGRAHPPGRRHHRPATGARGCRDHDAARRPRVGRLR